MQIEVRKSNSEWSKTKNISFNVIPIWYKTLWFKILFVVLSIILVVFLVGLFYRYRNQKTLEAKNLIELKSTLIQSELRTLRNQINPHMFANSMQTIQYYIYTKSKTEAADFVQKYSQLMRKNLDVGWQDLILLSDEIAYITDYCELEKMRRPENFEIDIVWPENLIPNTIKIPSLLIQPFLENAFKYSGINPGKSNIQIRVLFDFYEANMLKCTITNSTALPQTEMAAREVSGIEITKARFDLYNRALKQNGSVAFKSFDYNFESILHIPFVLSPQNAIV